MRQGIGWSGRESDHRWVTRGSANLDAARRPYPANHRSGTRGAVLCRSPLGRAPRLQPAEQSLVGLAFCDLYAGSGAVGLEAASRGANPVLLVERDPRTAQLAKDNAKALALVVDVVISSVEQLLRRPPARTFDVVFADPPYEMETLRSAPNSPTRRRTMGRPGLFDRGRTVTPYAGSGCGRKWLRSDGLALTVRPSCISGRSTDSEGLPDRAPC